MQTTAIACVHPAGCQKTEEMPRQPEALGGGPIVRTTKKPLKVYPAPFDKESQPGK
jgi:hypothetical protein